MSDHAVTHPWIDFAFNVDRLTPRTWMRLGEALSKCEHLAGSPLKPAIASELAKISLTKGVQATAAIEGNTLSLDQVRARIEGRQDNLPESQEYLGVEVDNIARALSQMDQDMREGRALPPLDTARILALHREVLQGMEAPPDRIPGQFRSHNVGVGTYPAPSAEHVMPLMTKLTEWLGELNPSQAGTPSQDRFMQGLMAAILAHLYIAWIHPFGDGNGRTARLVEAHILAGTGLVPSIAANLLSDHYNKTRSRYYEQLQRASAERQPYDFVAYAIEGFVSELREQIRVVRAHNLRVAWESYVYEAFSLETATEARDRRRLLALSLTNEWVTKQEATELNPALIRAYAQTGLRTPARDLNSLTEMRLAQKQGTRYRSSIEDLQAFTSPVAETSAEADLEALEDLSTPADAGQPTLFDGPK